MPLLDIHRLHVSLQGKPVLRGLTFSVPRGVFLGLLGPNGSGKTTLLRAISGILPYEGVLELEGRALARWKPGELARCLAFVRQSTALTFDFSVSELVMLGRSPHKSWFSGYSSRDRACVAEALAQVDLQGFGDRSVLSMSGGELQRVFLAQALVQEPRLLLLDEPTSHLDVHYQFDFLDRIRLLVENGTTVITVFHDLELAARYASQLVVLKQGVMAAEGSPEEVLTSEMIASVFRMDAEVVTAPYSALHIHYKTPLPPQRSTSPVAH